MLSVAKVMRITTGEEEEEFEDDSKNLAAGALGREAAGPEPRSLHMINGRIGIRKRICAEKIERLAA